MSRQRVVWLFTGSRLWDDQDAVERLFESQIVPGPQGDIVIHGYAAGLDTLASWACLKFGVMEVRVPYPKKYPGKSGGPVRNQTMLDIGRGMTGLGYALRCAAFHDDDGFLNPAAHSDTGDMVRRVKKHGIRVTRIRHAN